MDMFFVWIIVIACFLVPIIIMGGNSSNGHKQAAPVTFEPIKVPSTSDKLMAGRVAYRKFADDWEYDVRIASGGSILDIYDEMERQVDKVPHLLEKHPTIKPEITMFLGATLLVRNRMMETGFDEQYHEVWTKIENIIKSINE